MKYLLSILLLALAGCARFDASHTQVAPPARLDTTPQPGPPLAEVVELAGEVVALQHEVKQQTETVQQSAHVAGVQMQKIGDVVKGLETNLEASLSAKAEAHLRAVAQVETSLRNEMNAELSAVAQAHAALRAEVASLVSGQAGLTNTIQQQRQEISAGRDAVTNTIQYSREMMERDARTEQARTESTYILISGLVAVAAYLVRMHAKIQSEQTRQVIEVVTRMADLAEHVDDDQSKCKTRRIPKPEVKHGPV